MVEYLKNMGGKLALGAVGVAALLGYKFYQRGASESETRSELLALCEGDAECKSAVEKHFPACHEAAYRLGGRRQAGGLNSQQLTSCINSAAGQQLFVAE